MWHFNRKIGKAMEKMARFACLSVKTGWLRAVQGDFTKSCNAKVHFTYPRHTLATAGSSGGVAGEPHLGRRPPMGTQAVMMERMGERCGNKWRMQDGKYENVLNCVLVSKQGGARLVRTRSTWDDDEDREQVRHSCRQPTAEPGTPTRPWAWRRRGLQPGQTRRPLPQLPALACRCALQGWMRGQSSTARHGVRECVWPSRSCECRLGLMLGPGCLRAALTQDAAHGGGQRRKDGEVDVQPAAPAGLHLALLVCLALRRPHP